jgi:hypothetical protein
MSDETVDVGLVQVTRLLPGDVLLFHSDCWLSTNAANGIREAIKERFPGHEAVVVQGGKLSVIREGNG